MCSCIASSQQSPILPQNHCVISSDSGPAGRKDGLPLATVVWTTVILLPNSLAAPQTKSVVARRSRKAVRAMEDSQVSCYSLV